MGAATKIILGLVLIVIGLGLFVDSVKQFLPNAIHWPWLESFKTLVLGVVPIFLILLGLLVVWLEVDEMKMEKELRKEEKDRKGKEDKKKK
jgi:uncharacterized membrane protein YdbT with pleckstrin-like domain